VHSGIDEAQSFAGRIGAHVDDLKLDRVERRVERAGPRIELTSKEFKEALIAKIKAAACAKHRCPRLHSTSCKLPSIAYARESCVTYDAVVR
jgi:hypothetical protein